MTTIIILIQLANFVINTARFVHEPPGRNLIDWFLRFFQESLK